MSKPDFKAMSRNDLQAYVLSHREDEEAFYIYVDKLHSESTWVEMPALQSVEDLKNYPEFIERTRNTYNQSNIGIGHVSGGTFNNNKIAGTINEAPNPSLTNAAAEIRDLLTEIEKSYPTTTTSEKMAIATEAIKRIEANPDWKKRIVNALKGGSIAALEKAIDNPAGAFLKGAFEGWEKEN